MEKLISIAFRHGLGDCVNCAFLLPLYLRRGYAVEVETDPSLAPLFLAAGATICETAKARHNWLHHPYVNRLDHCNDWTGNKGGFNISQPPLPNIGHYRDLWDEYIEVKLDLDQFVTPEVKADVDGYLAGMPRPLFVVHTAGNTAPGLKNPPEAEILDLYRTLLDQTDGSVLVVDWDGRSPKLRNGRFRHTGTDWHKLDLASLYYLLASADCFLGPDSGPLHLTRFTSTPAVGLWVRHHPCNFALPRWNTLHVLPSGHAWTAFRRYQWNLVESGALFSGEFAARQAVAMLAGGKLLADPGKDLVLSQLLDRCRQTEKTLAPYGDRHKSFRLFLSLLPSGARVAETGTIRQEEDWGSGFSTYLFGLYLAETGGKLWSVDVDKKNCIFSRQWTQVFGNTVSIVHCHSHEWLRTAGPLDAIYLDSADVGTPNFQEICVQEAELALPLLKEKGLILIDDSPYVAGQWTGKGAKAIPFLLSRGWKIAFSGYQCLLWKGY